MKYTDEQLSAYLDGELSPAECDAIETALGSDDVLAKRLDKLVNVNTALKDTFDDVLEAPIPSQIEAMLGKASAASDTSNVIDFSDRKPAINKWQLPAAIAASLVVGFFASQQMSSVSAPSHQLLATGPVAPNSKLFTALNSGASGKANAGIEPVLTFKSVDGKFCREFTTSSTRGLACRESEDWVVVAQIYAPSSGNSGEFATASSQSIANFDLLVENLMDGDILDSENELKTINAGWK